VWQAHGVAGDGGGAPAKVQLNRTAFG
jgi:hypothetical protein